MPLGTKAIDKLLRDAKSGNATPNSPSSMMNMDCISRATSTRGCSALTVGGKRRWMGVGRPVQRHPGRSRELARKARGLAAAGTDPIEARKVERAASVVLSVDAALAHYFKTHMAEWRSPKTRLGFEHLCRDHIAPTIGKLSVATLTYTDVLRVFEPHWATKTTSMVRLGAGCSLLGSDAWQAGWADRGPKEPRRAAAAHDLASPCKISKPEHHPAMPWVCPTSWLRCGDVGRRIHCPDAGTVNSSVRAMMPSTSRNAAMKSGTSTHGIAG